MSENLRELEETVRTQRHDFTKGKLDEEGASKDPFKQFAEWLDVALKGGNQYGNAMALSTVDSEGMPSSRIMLLRDISCGGFTFFTNYQSRKAKDLRGNDKAAILFFWPELERQVRVQGHIEVLPEKESDDYFGSRPFESRVGAWASAQSCVISGRRQLEMRYQQALELFKGKNVPRPVSWGGYVLKPTRFEFWQGRASRLHDRLQYTFNGSEQSWQIERLMP